MIWEFDTDIEEKGDTWKQEINCVTRLCQDIVEQRVSEIVKRLTLLRITNFSILRRALINHNVTGYSTSKKNYNSQKIKIE